jgi:hypothetical protein
VDTKDWIATLQGYEAYPLLIIATVVIAGAAFWSAWKLRGHIASGAIDALTKTIETMNQRLNLAQDGLTALQRQLAEMKEKVDAQAEEIVQLRASGVAGVERLAQSNNAIQKSLTDLATSTTTLDRTFSDIREWANVRQRPLRFVTDDHNTTWSPAKLGNQQGSHLHGYWRVTNLSERDVFILKARIEGHDTEFGHVATQAPDRQSFGSFPILPNWPSELIADLPFFASICSGRKPFVADVIFTDNFEAEHRVPAVRFAYRGP